jgi:SAM-dependent methyltransferase
MQTPAEFDRLSADRGWAGLARLTLRDGRWTSSTTPTDTAFTADLQSAVSLAAEGSWWYSTRNTMICDLIDRQHVHGPMWEIGSGSGLVAAALEAHGLELVAVEPSAGSVLAARRGVATSVDSTLEQLALPTASLASIGLFDVLEHVSDRVSFLGEIHRVLSPSGRLVLSVPALGWLWSDADVQAGHRCRYDRRSLRRELEAAGFEVTTLGYRFASLVVPLAAGRSVPYRLGIHRAPEVALQQVARSPGKLGTFLTGFERRVGPHLPFGTSLFAVARAR